MRKQLKIERLNLLVPIRQAELKMNRCAIAKAEFNRLVGLYNTLTVKLESL